MAWSCSPPATPASRASARGNSPRAQAAHGRRPPWKMEENNKDGETYEGFQLGKWGLPPSQLDGDNNSGKISQSKMGDWDV